MTISDPLGTSDEDHQELKSRILAVRETSAVRDRLKSTTCRWCGVPIEYNGVGRPRQYCRDSHRSRASELRTVQRLAGLPVEKGGRTTEPVREVIERTETQTRTTVRTGPARLRMPQSPPEWAVALHQLRRAVRGGRFPGFDDLLLRDLEETIRVVRECRTGALDTTGD
ncbi:hypothetical protein ACGFYV_17430 [Streptomyces sp. NPDC048297]|uniref:hypothetical protein n=1 Tax=Streptomyces sp. NPDC048297 TaxID=3365531 RepID=UPI003716F80A